MTVFAVIFALFVILNAAISQFYPALYFQGLVNERETAVPYLKSIQSLPGFQSELDNLTSVYGDSVTEGVFYDDSMRENYIKELEQLYVKNPSSRDINYQLSLLYGQKGETVKSREYLQKARAIDPAL